MPLWFVLCLTACTGREPVVASDKAAVISPQQWKRLYSRPYSELTAEEKAKLNADYEAMPPGDEPPYPLGGLVAYSDPLSRRAFERRAVGELKAVSTVDASGRVTGTVVHALPEGLGEDDVKRVMSRVPFKPAVCGGRTCVMDFLITMNFQVERSR